MTADTFVINQDDLVEVVIPEPQPIGVVLIGGPSGDKGDPGLIWRGEYDGSGYNIGDVVSLDGSAYVCLVDGTVGSPVDYPSRWNLLASKGSQGEPGTTTWGGITDKPTVIAAGATPEDARNAINAQSQSWLPAATDITDATPIGRSVLTADTQQDARTAIGAGTSSLSLGSTSSTAKPGDWTPTSTDISDSTATGRSVLTAASASAARSAIGAEDASQKGQANGYAGLDSGGKVPISQLPATIMEYQGTYNASTGTPALANGTGNLGDVYRVSMAGTKNFGAGPITFRVGDYVIYNGAQWEKSATTDTVASVNGYKGDVTLAKSDIGLGSVDNTADSAKVVASAGKLTTARSINGVAFDGTADITVADSTREPAVSAGTTSQYYRGDKSWQTLNKAAVGLGSVDNTSDATKNSAVAALTNKDLTSGTNTFPTFNQNTSGNAATATKLATARSIDGQSFDGTADITVIAPGTNAATSKSTPVDADSLPLVDSEASNGLKRLTWASLKATLKAYFDSLATTLSNKTLASPALTGTAKFDTTGSIELYNTSDQTTNTEKGVFRYNGNVLEIGHAYTGTGNRRQIKIGGGTTNDGTIFRALVIDPGTLPFFQFPSGTSLTGATPGAAAIVKIGGGNLNSSSNFQSLLSVDANAYQTGTASYCLLHLNATEVTTGSGTKRLIDAQVGGTSKFVVDNTGAVSVSGTTASIRAGSGSPESAVAANVGSMYLRTDGGAGSTLYIKESGTGSTGWVAK